MELKCPQCGKWMAVSQEELMMHDCQVVCPQCLAVCHYEGGALVARDDSDAPYRHNASVDTSVEHDASRYCHSCGRKLPDGISFCPYCGVDLKAPFDNAEPAPASKPEAAPQAKPASQPQAATQPDVAPQPERSRPAAPRSHASQVEDKLRTMPHRYKAMQPHLYQNGTMPSTAFKVFAYIVIALLLILLAYIIYAGMSLEPAM